MVFLALLSISLRERSSVSVLATGLALDFLGVDSDSACLI